MGEPREVVDDFRSRAKKKTRTKKQIEKLEKTANYFERNLKYMAYDAYLAHGWPIASGVIEGACRHFVKDRFELSGMRWEQSGAENLLRLRAVAENEDWDNYHLFHHQQRHQRLYTSPFPTQHSLETLALELPSPTILQAEDSNAATKTLVHPLGEQQPFILENSEKTASSDYYTLPLIV